MLGDEVGNQLDATALGDVEALNQGESDGRRLNLAGHLGAQALDELMWNHEDENVGILGGLDDIGNGNLWTIVWIKIHASKHHCLNWNIS